MRRLLATVLLFVFPAGVASCSNDEPPRVIGPTSAFRPTGSTGRTAASGPTSTGSRAGGAADASNVGLGGLSFTGTKPTSSALTLTVTVQAKGTR